MLLFLLIFSLRPAHSDSVGCDRRPIHYFAENISDVLKNYEILNLKKDPHAYCDQMMLRRYVEANFKEDANADHLNDQQINKKVDAFLKVDGEGGFVALPRKDFVEAVAVDAIQTPNDDGVFAGTDKVGFQNQLAIAMKTIATPSKCSFPYHHGESLSELSKDEGLAGNLDESESLPLKIAERIGPPIICSETVSYFAANGCGEAFNRNVTAIRQRGSPPITSMPDLFDEMINSGIYDRGLSIMAKKMASQLAVPNQIRSDVFSDLKKSYREAGYNTRVAEKLTYDTLGLIATGGPAIGARLKHIAFPADSWPTVTALTTVAGLLPVLDYYSSQSRDLYSLPPGVHGRCNTSKSYHFWMAAYFAHKERSNGLSAEAAASAAFAVSKLYPVLGNLTNRTGAAPLFLHRPFSPASNIIRVDLADASAGAVFGAGGKHLNIDDGVESLIKNSRVLPALSVPEAINAVSPWNLFGYSRFSQI